MFSITDVKNVRLRLTQSIRAGTINPVSWSTGHVHSNFEFRSLFATTRAEIPITRNSRINAPRILARASFSLKGCVLELADTPDRSSPESRFLENFHSRSLGKCEIPRVRRFQPLFSEPHSPFFSLMLPVAAGTCPEFARIARDNRRNLISLNFSTGEKFGRSQAAKECDFNRWMRVACVVTDVALIKVNGQRNISGSLHHDCSEGGSYSNCGRLLILLFINIWRNKSRLLLVNWVVQVQALFFITVLGF